MTEPAQDEFVDSREETDAPEEPAEAADDAGGGDDMVFMDDLDAPPSSGQPAVAPAPEAKPAGGPSTPKSGGQTRPPAPAPATGSGAHGRPGAPGRASSDSNRLPRGSPGSDPGGKNLSQSGVHGQAGKRPSESGVFKPSESGSFKKPSESGVHGRRPSSDPGLKRSSDSGRNVTQLSASGRQKALGPSQRPERSREEDAAALAALDARVVPAPQGDPFIGKELGPFAVEGFIELDRGERRYKAILQDQQRPILLRVFPLHGTWGDEFKRIADRAERACRVEGPGLEAAWHAGRTKDAFYAGFDPPLGRTLSGLLREAPLDEPATLALVEQLARGLSALHGRDMAHGHVSPDVIRQLRPGTWALEAAGLARARPALGFLSAGGDVLGLPGYIAPETIDGGEQTRASDLYSLGCVAWTAVSGKPPFRGEDEVQVLLQQLASEVPPLAPAGGKAASRPFDTIVRKLVGFTPEVRYRDAKDMLIDLRARERGDEVKPFEAAARPQEAAAAPKLQGSGIALVVLVVLDVVLALGLLAVVSHVRTIELQDPIAGFQLTMPAPPPVAPVTPTPPPAQPPPGER